MVWEDTMNCFYSNLSDSCVQNELEGGETGGRVGWVPAGS